MTCKIILALIIGLHLGVIGDKLWHYSQNRLGLDFNIAAELYNSECVLHITPRKGVR